MKQSVDQTLKPSYFSRYALQQVYLKSPQHAKYINASLLEKYYPIGGVRIEDDILVTPDGYEVLTTAPKGEEACRIIRGENVSTTATNRPGGAPNHARCRTYRNGGSKETVDKLLGGVSR